MKNIATFWFTFQVNLICFIPFGSASSACCLLKSIAIILRYFLKQKTSRIIISLTSCNFSCYRMFLNHFLLADQKSFFVDQPVNLLFWHLKENIAVCCKLSSNDKQKVWLLPENVDQLNNLIISLVLIDIYSS